MNIAYRHRRHRLALFINEGLTQTTVIERFLTANSLMFVRWSTLRGVQTKGAVSIQSSLTFFTL